jgi:asparagine synthase (glutamine-hydrolysing)
MCGIAGQWHYRTGRSVDEVELIRLRDAQVHRGPDDAGLWVQGAVGLAHRRLAILDLSVAGRQPMGYGRVQVVFNGEIYNYRQIRSRLEGQGHRFSTSSDTEILAPLYLERGLDFVQELRGMFAIALWDGERERLVLVRDRFGKKPLLYAETPRGITFASEMQGVLQDPQVARVIDPPALDAYLTLGYVPHPATIFQGVHKLRPAHRLVVEQGRVREERYWRPTYQPKVVRSETEWIERLLSALRESVRLRMISDVPLGAFLSGGIDSSAVVGLMAEVSSRPVKTFTIGFDEARYNELDAARTVARHFGTDHEEHVVHMNAVDVLPKLVRHYGEPYADSSALPTYYLCDMTRRHVTVALSGDAGDELFGGYNAYRALRFRRRASIIPRSLRSGAAQILSPWVDRNVDHLVWWRRLRNTLQESLASLPEQHRVLSTTFRDAQRMALYTPALGQQLNGCGLASQAFLDAYQESDASDEIERASAMDVATYLPADILTKVDIASMAHSLEVRCPFLDHEFAGEIFRMPFDLKLRGLTGKYILRKALARLIPQEILARPKQGFAVPLDAWFRSDLAGLARELFAGTRSHLGEFLRADQVGQILDDHLQRRRNNGRLLWSLTCLELWFREFIVHPEGIAA